MADDSSPSPVRAPSRINSSTQASGLVPLSTAGQGRVMAPAALPKPLIIPAGGRRVLGLGFGGHPGGNVGSALLWVKLPRGLWAGRGQEVGGWAAGVTTDQLNQNPRGGDWKLAILIRSPDESVTQ